MQAGDHVRGVPGARQQALLLRLLVAAGAPVGPWQLRHDVWAGRHKSDAALRVAINRLRNELAAAGAPDVIHRASDGYLLDRRAVDVDADTAQPWSSRRTARSATIHAGRPTRRPAPSACGAGPAFGELRDEAFLLAEAERLASLRRDAVEVRLTALLALDTARPRSRDRGRRRRRAPARAAHRPADGRPLPQRSAGGRAGRVPAPGTGLARRPRAVAERRAARARSAHPAARPHAAHAGPAAAEGTGRRPRWRRRARRHRPRPVGAGVGAGGCRRAVIAPRRLGRRPGPGARRRHAGRVPRRRRPDRRRSPGAVPTRRWRWTKRSPSPAAAATGASSPWRRSPGSGSAWGATTTSSPS